MPSKPVGRPGSDAGIAFAARFCKSRGLIVNKTTRPPRWRRWRHRLLSMDRLKRALYRITVQDGVRQGGPHASPS